MSKRENWEITREEEIELLRYEIRELEDEMEEEIEELEEDYLEEIHKRKEKVKLIEGSG